MRELSGQFLGWFDDSPPAIRHAFAACRRHLFYALLFSALLNLLFIAPMLYMLQVYDRVIPTGGGVTLLAITLVLLFALGTLALLDLIRNRLLVRASLQLDQSLSPQILGAALSRSGVGSQRLSRQALREFDILKHALTGPVMMGLFDVPWVPIYVLVAALISPWIGLLALVGAALSGFLAWCNERATNSRLQEASRAAGRAYAVHEAALQNADIVRALGIRRAMVAGQIQDRGSVIRLQSEASFGGGQLTALTKFTRLVLQSSALGLAALLAIEGKVSAGAVFASTFIVGRALAPMDQLVGGWRSIVQARGAYRTLKDLFAEAGPDLALTQLPAPQGKLQLDRVAVTDSNGRAIINNVSFKVEPGELVAIVGPSGAGKSTLARVIAGAAIPAAGTIRFDGADQRNWDPELLAAHIGYMPQEQLLFMGTIKQNIARFADALEADVASIDEAAVAAAQLAGAHELILALRDGYDHVIAMGGRGLSAGQAQRISLARSLFREPKYVILDEPNSNLDADGDRQLIETLAELKKRGRTVLIVAHRLSMLPIVDKILVMQNGSIGLYGSREEVLRQIAPGASSPRIVAGKEVKS